MLVAVVGGAGFLGTAICKRLTQAGHKVRVIDTSRRLTRISDDLVGMEQIDCKFSCTEQFSGVLSGVDVLMHLACTTTPAESMGNISAAVEGNVLPSLRLFEEAAASSVSRVIFSSSGGTVYGAPKMFPVLESSELNPLSIYGAIKVAIENFLTVFVNQNSFEGVSLRVANPYGSYQFRGGSIGVIAKCMSDLASGRHLTIWGDGEVVRDYIHIDDVAEAFYLSATKKYVQSGIYNIGSGEGKSLNELIQLLQRLTGRDITTQFLEARPFDVPKIILDNSKFTEHFDWRQGHNLYSGISEMWESLSEQSQLIASV